MGYKPKCPVCGSGYGCACKNEIPPPPSGHQERHDEVVKRSVKSAAFDTQVGGSHYKGKAIQPIEYIMANKLDFNEGSVVKYITRHKEKGGAQDIEKIKQYCDFILKYQYGK